VTRILVVDDEAQLRRALDLNLAARGYEVDTAASGEDAIRLAATTPPDVVLLDLGLPGIDGLDVVRQLREWSTVPIVVLSARDAESAKVAALAAGADDYVTKPFGIDELLGRVRAALRRHQPASDTATIRTADFTVDLAAGTAWRAGDEVRLTPVEWRLLRQLVRNPGRLLTPRWLLQQAWGPWDGGETSDLRRSLASLRRKLEPNPSEPRYFITEPGMGYRFEPGGEPREDPPAGAPTGRRTP
jgi:two-component system, OmpR family, KDP operon response regulator KdpE